MYTESWTNPVRNPADTGATDDLLARTYASRLLRTLGLKDFRNKRILDFGAGKGAMLRALQEMGADAYGIEPYGYEFLNEAGYKVFKSLAQVPPHVKFDGVISLMVIEHLEKPWEELSQLRDLLDDAGWIYVGTLNAHGLNARARGSRWREVLKPAHLVFFSPINLSRVLDKSGFLRIQRLVWIIRFSKSPFRTFVHIMLQALRMDGELRYLAWKSLMPFDRIQERDR